MKLPFLDIKLSEWKETDFDKIVAAEKVVVAIAKGAGMNSDTFQVACRRLLAMVMAGAGTDWLEEITTPVDVRACTFLLVSSDDFCQLARVDRNLLGRLLMPRRPMTKLSLMQLIRAFLERFDLLAEGRALGDWCDFLREQLAGLGGDNNTSDLVRYSRFSEIIFSVSGPSKVVNFARENGIDFDAALRKLGLNGFADGRYIKLCRYQYYLETLRTMEVGENHPVLKEVVKSDVVNAPAAEGKLLGHSIIEILIDRSAGKVISQAWQNAILTIAGDPRVPKSSASYQQWWSIIGDKRIALMRGWLSRFDLALFLGVLEQSAKDDRNDAMERMFAPRKTFMEGLVEQEAVYESRLFLTSSAESYLKKNYKKEKLPSYALVKGGQASVIYLQLKNGLHMVEGTHSFSIRVMNKLPEKPGITDYSIDVFNSRDLGVGLAEFYLWQFQRDGGLMETAHNPDLTWQNKVISHLAKFNLKLDVGKLIAPSKYRTYKSKFGAS
ncbi:hypothetical protein GSF27_14010 [Pseudomaricurvus sp. HS19]|nr:hypothetical protein [Pseudomaricurvus sp. HS19]